MKRKQENDILSDFCMFFFFFFSCETWTFRFFFFFSQFRNFASNVVAAEMRWLTFQKKVDFQNFICSLCEYYIFVFEGTCGPAK